MSPTLTTFLFETVNFLVLATVLGWLFFKPVRQALADRQAKFESESRRIAEKLAEAEQAEQEINTTRANLQVELNDQRVREVAAAKQAADNLLAEARTIAQRERDISRRLAVQMSDAQRDVLAQVAAAAAGNTVGHLLEQIRGPELHAALVKSAYEQLRSLPQEAVAAITLESTQPLSVEQRAKLRDILGSAADNADFKTVDGLGAGVRISTGKGLIDASVSGLSQFARQSLISEMNLRANHQNPMQDSTDA